MMKDLKKIATRISGLALAVVMIPYLLISILFVDFLPGEDSAGAEREKKWLKK